eukprot:TRINITY_DN2033_c0_g1_i2.p1 TRINITY_DN2033_c0_g1~~TRINITY_DN2033_c0_g1_i2.p1  ORF type:complete len:983 (+),score=121.99 TRINITY_DN2033_c0_g1_i2:1038-3986(+)
MSFSRSDTRGDCWLKDKVATSTDLSTQNDDYKTYYVLTTSTADVSSSSSSSTCDEANFEASVSGKYYDLGRHTYSSSTAQYYEAGGNLSCSVISSNHALDNSFGLSTAVKLVRDETATGMTAAGTETQTASVNSLLNREFSCAYELELTGPASSFGPRQLDPDTYNGMILYAYSRSQSYCYKVIVGEKIEQDVKANTPIWLKWAVFKSCNSYCDFTNFEGGWDSILTEDGKLRYGGCGKVFGAPQKIFGAASDLGSYISTESKVQSFGSNQNCSVTSSNRTLDGRLKLIEDHAAVYLTAEVFEPSPCTYELVLTGPPESFGAQTIDPDAYNGVVFYLYSYLSRTSKGICLKITVGEKIEADSSATVAGKDVCNEANFQASGAPKGSIDWGSFSTTETYIEESGKKGWRQRFGSKFFSCELNGGSAPTISVLKIVYDWTSSGLTAKVTQPDGCNNDVVITGPPSFFAQRLTTTTTATSTTTTTTNIAASTTTTTTTTAMASTTTTTTNIAASTTTTTTTTAMASTTTAITTIVASTTITTTTTTTTSMTTDCIGCIPLEGEADGIPLDQITPFVPGGTVGVIDQISTTTTATTSTTTTTTTTMTTTTTTSTTTSTTTIAASTTTTTTTTAMASTTTTITTIVASTTITTTTTTTTSTTTTTYADAIGSIPFEVPFDEWNQEVTPIAATATTTAAGSTTMTTTTSAPCSSFISLDECPPRCTWTGSTCEANTSASTAPTTSIKFSITLEFDNASSFNATAFLQGIASALGVNATDVKMDSLHFEIQVEYNFSQSMTEEELEFIILQAAGVDPNANARVQVVIRNVRRLAGMRRLSSNGISVQANIISQDATAVDRIASNVEDMSLLTDAMESRGIMNVVPKVTAPAKTTVVAVTALKDVESGAVKVPSTDELSTELGNAMGVNITATVQAVQKAYEVTSTTSQSLAGPDEASGSRLPSSSTMLAFQIALLISGFFQASEPQGNE